MGIGWWHSSKKGAITVPAEIAKLAILLVALAGMWTHRPQGLR
jgi:hypothetical protein